MSDLDLLNELYAPTFRSEWTRHSLFDLATWINGMAFKNIHFSETGRPVIKIAEIKSKVTSQTRFTDAEYNNKYLLEVGDILFCWSGQPETSIDTFRWAGPQGWLNQHIFKVLPHGDLVDREYFFHLMKYLKPNFIRIARNKQTTGLGHVTQGDLKQFSVALPPISLQKVLSEPLEVIVLKMESNRRLQSSLELLAHAHFERLFDVDHDESGVALSELISVNPRRSLTKGVEATYVPMAHLPEFSAEVYDWERRIFGSGQRFVNGDVLLARITPCLENGKTAIVDMLDDGEVGWGSTEYLVLAPTDRCSTAWIYCLARSAPVREFAIRSMTGSSGRQRFQAGNFDSYKIPAPCSESLEVFSQLVDPIFEKLTLLRDENRQLARLYEELIPEIVSGRRGASMTVEVVA